MPDPSEYDLEDPDNKRLYAFLKMGDLATQEKQLATQQAQAQSLRNSGMQPSSGRHWTKQASKVFQGLGGLLGQRRVDQGTKDFTANKQAAMGELASLLLKKPQPKYTPPTLAAPAAAPVPMPDPTSVVREDEFGA